MSDLNIQSKDYSSFDFSTTDLVSDKAKAQELLANHDEAVRFSLDRDNNLVAFRLPVKRDNGFVAFFKYIFSSSYRKQRELLKNYDLLKNNASFNKRVTEEIIAKGSYSETQVRFAKAKLEAVKGMEDRFEYTPAMLNDALDLARSSLSDKRAISTFTINDDGKILSPQQFLKKYADADFPSYDKVAQGLMEKILAGDNEEYEQYLDEKDRSRLEALLSKSKSLSKSENNELAALVSTAATALYTKLGEAVDEAMSFGKDKRQCARDLATALNVVADSSAPYEAPGESLNRIKSNVLLSKMKEFDSSVLSPQEKAVFDKLKTGLPKLDDKKLLMIMRFLDENNISEKTYLRVHEQTHKIRSELLELTKLTDDKEFFAAVFKNFRRELSQSLSEIYPNVDKNDPDDKIVAEFAAIVGLDICLSPNRLSPENVQSLERLNRILAGINDIGREGVIEEHRQTSTKVAQWSVANFLSSMFNTMGSLFDNRAHFNSYRVNYDDLSAKEKLIGARIDVLYEVPQVIDEVLNAHNISDPKERAFIGNYLELMLDDSLSTLSTLDSLKSFDFKGELEEIFLQLQGNETLKKVMTPLAPLDDTATAGIKDFLMTSKRDEMGELTPEARENSGSLSICDSFLFQWEQRGQNFLANGFHNTFVADAKRGFISEIEGQNVKYNEHKAQKLLADMLGPDYRNFVPQVSFMMQQGGILGTLSMNYLMEPVKRDSAVPSTVEIMMQGLMQFDGGNNTVSVYKDDSDVLHFKVDYYSKFGLPKNGLTVQKFHVGAEFTLDLKQGLDDKGVPKGFKFVSISRENAPFL